MKLYDFTRAPNPRRVRIFLAEKGITVPTVQVDLMTGANRSPEGLQRNPYGGLPVLELDDGTCIAESVAICRYFDETHPQPPLMGVDAKDKAIVEMWQRRIEINLFGQIGRYFQHTAEMFKTRIKQVPEIATAAREAATAQLYFVDRLIGGHPFVAGERYTIADITLLVAVDFGKFAGIQLEPDMTNLARWHGAVSARPSARA